MRISVVIPCFDGEQFIGEALQSALGQTLAYAPVRLDDYRDKPLDDALFTSLNEGFSVVRSTGIKVILRFVYNDGFDPDAPKARVLEHIGQLKGTLEANADVIAVLKNPMHTVVKQVDDEEFEPLVGRETPA